MYTLHGFCQSGNTFKVAFLLRALNQPWEPRFVDFMNGVTRTGEWREAMNEMGEVPVLDDGNRRLTLSGVILTYLASKYGLFGGQTDEARLEVLRWLLFDNHKLTSYFASYRFMKAFGPSVRFDARTSLFEASGVDLTRIPSIEANSIPGTAGNGAEKRSGKKKTRPKPRCRWDGQAAYSTLALARNSSWYLAIFCCCSCWVICGLTSSNFGNWASRTSSSRMM